MRHTPGPWSVGSVVTTSGAEVRADAAIRPNFEKTKGALIAMVKHVPFPDLKWSETDGNALLIAAAPDLLAALEAVQRLLHEGGDEQILPAEIAQDIAAAIAKAKGNG